MIKDLIQELINLEKEKALVEEDIEVVKGQIEKEITEVIRMIPFPFPTVNHQPQYH